MSKFELLPLEIVAVVIGETEVVRPLQGTAENSYVIDPPLPLDLTQKDEAIYTHTRTHTSAINCCLIFSITNVTSEDWH